MMEATQKYLDGCREDLDAAKALLDAGQPFYVPFICHQALFKVLRGYYLESRNSYPLADVRLNLIAEEGGAAAFLSDEDKALLVELSFFPDAIAHSVYREKLWKHSENAREILDRTRRVAEAVLSKIR